MRVAKPENIVFSLLLASTYLYDALVAFVLPAVGATYCTRTLIRDETECAFLDGATYFVSSVLYMPQNMNSSGFGVPTNIVPYHKIGTEPFSFPFQ